MQNQNKDKWLRVTVVTPDDGETVFTCETVRFPILDGKSGTGGGLYGVRFGHAPAVFALASGTVTGFTAGDLVFGATCAAGFVRVSADGVTVVTDHADISKKP